MEAAPLMTRMASLDFPALTNGNNPSSLTQPPTAYKGSSTWSWYHLVLGCQDPSLYFRDNAFALPWLSMQILKEDLWWRACQFGTLTSASAGECKSSLAGDSWSLGLWMKESYDFLSFSENFDDQKTSQIYEKSAKSHMISQYVWIRVLAQFRKACWAAQFLKQRKWPIEDLCHNINVPKSSVLRLRAKWPITTLPNTYNEREGLVIRMLIWFHKVVGFRKLFVYRTLIKCHNSDPQCQNFLIWTRQRT